jgi:orotidine-5'-phosphate decarboxylase
MKKTGKDYIVFPLDVPSSDQAKALVTRLAGHVGMFKIGLELFVGSGPSLVDWVIGHAGADVFLDLKLHDIPTTVGRAMERVAALGVKLVTVHCGESLPMLEAAVAGSQGRVGVLGVTVLTSVSPSDLATGGYREDLAGAPQRLVMLKAEMARKAGCAGVVCSGLEAAAVKAQCGEGFLAVTPGIRPAWGAGKKDDQRRVVTPAMAVEQGADYIVVGRPIRDADDPVDAAGRIGEEIDRVSGGAFSRG